MAIIKIEELNAVSELTSEELSLTKGGHHEEQCGCRQEKCCDAPFIYIGDDVVSTGDIVFTGIGATFSKSFNDALNGNYIA